MEALEDKDIFNTSSVQMVGLSVTMAARAIESLFNAKLKASGVTMSKLYIMYALAEYRGRSISYISKKLGMDRSTMNRMISKNKNHFAFYKDDSDSRFSYPALTYEGAEFLKKWMPTLISLEIGLGILVKDKGNFINFIKKFSSDIAKAKKDEGIEESTQEIS
jgi:DNA-binding MarR family transcriptional regulator